MAVRLHDGVAAEHQSENHWLPPSPGSRSGSVFSQRPYKYQLQPGAGGGGKSTLRNIYLITIQSNFHVTAGPSPVPVSVRGPLHPSVLLL